MGKRPACVFPEFARAALAPGREDAIGLFLRVFWGVQAGMRFFAALGSMVLFASLLCAEPMPGTVLTIVPDHAGGVYAVGEKVTWTIDVKSGDRATLGAVPYSVKRDAKDEVEQGTLDLTAGSATVTATRAEPGALYAVFSSPDKAEKKPIGYGGAVFAPEKIGPAVPAPEDFDEFWQEKLKELASVPMNAVEEAGSLEGVPNGGGVDYWKVTLDNIRGTHVRGQLARPAKEGKFPAVLALQYAGVYPLNKGTVANLAKEGFLVFNIEAHDIPIDESPEFYKKAETTTLRDYVHIGGDDREKSYFLRMFLGDVRAAEYLASRPEWDGRTFLVTGTSQGGMQAFATAALFPKATHLMVHVPAGCDNCASLATPPRAYGWPYWLSAWPQAPNSESLCRTAGYFDAIHFAARVRCPSLVAVGLVDDTARPAGVCAAYNAIPAAEKELVIMPFSQHQNIGDTQVRWGLRSKAWKEAMKAGQPLPPPEAN